MSTSPHFFSDQTSGTGSSWSEAVESLFSYNGNVMLAAVISLLLVVLFVLLLHLYAKWFLAQSRRRRRPSSLSVTHVLGPNPLPHFHTFSDSPMSKGLDASVVAAIPLFVYCSEEHAEVYQECVICLGGYEDGDIGRCLGKCGHAFHVECIDMWLQSHSSCPICRSPAVPETDDQDQGHDVIDEANGSLEIVIDIIADQDRSVDESESDGCAISAATTPSCSCPCPVAGLGSSLKRMMSCNSKSERKVHPCAT